jgi:hypothetical protein
VPVSFHALSNRPLGISYQSTKASPPKIMVKNSDGSSAEELANGNHHKVLQFRTKSALWYSALLAILVVVCAQLVIAKDLVRFSNLQSYEPRHPPNTANAAGVRFSRWLTYLLELCVSGLIAGVLVCLVSAMFAAVAMHESRGYPDAA